MEKYGEVDFKDYIRTVPDFPKPGIDFYDIGPLLADSAVFQKAVFQMAGAATVRELAFTLPTKIVCFDARGFLFGGAMVAEEAESGIETGLVPIRKKGKLPGETHQVSYELEYGTDTIEIQKDALKPADNVILVDDVIATGGTALAGIELVRKSGAHIVNFTSLIDLPELGGSQLIEEAGVPVHALVTYGGGI